MFFKHFIFSRSRFALLSGIFLFSGLEGISAFNSASGADFLNTNLSTRSEGMAGSDVAIITDVSGMNINPAAIAFMKVPEVYYMHKTTLSEFHTEYLAAGVPMSVFLAARKDLPKKLRWMRELNLATSVMYWHTGLIDVYDNESNKSIGTVGARDVFGSLGAGYNVRGYRIGGTFKFINRALADYTASTIAFDFGALRGFEVFRPLPYQRRYNLRVGFAATNLGPGITFDKTTESLPMKFKPGVTYGIFGNRDHMVDVSLGITKIIKEDITINTGVEYRVFDALYFRSGLEFTGDGPVFTLGTGGKYTFRRVTYRLDYAFWSRANGVPDNHTISLLAQLEFIQATKRKRVTSLGIIEGETKDTEEPKKKKKKIKIK